MICLGVRQRVFQGAISGLMPVIVVPGMRCTPILHTKLFICCIWLNMQTGIVSCRLMPLLTQRVADKADLDEGYNTFKCRMVKPKRTQTVCSLWTHRFACNNSGVVAYTVPLSTPRDVLFLVIGVLKIRSGISGKIATELMLM